MAARARAATHHVLDVLAEGTHLLAGGSALDLPSSARAGGATYAGLALPVDGDPLGLGGPRDFNAAALEAGQAVVAGALGLVPVEQGETVQWQVFEAGPRQWPELGEADRGLREAARAPISPATSPTLHLAKAGGPRPPTH